MNMEIIEKDLRSYASPEKAKILQRFFKTGKGEYGEGDEFLGIVVPNIRKLCKKYYKEMSFEDVGYFLRSRIHEFRLFAILVLTYMYEKASRDSQKEIYLYYIKNIKYINNWDLVDLSSPKIVGDYLLDKDRSILNEMILSKNMWEQRIAILATFTFIKNNEYEEIFYFSKLLINHPHDLIHKALGWMLREVGKRDVSVLRDFLDKNYRDMPRTMLRYSIEKFDKEERLMYLNKS